MPPTETTLEHFKTPRLFKHILIHNFDYRFENDESGTCKALLLPEGKGGDRLCSVEERKQRWFLGTF